MTHTRYDPSIAKSLLFGVSLFSFFRPNLLAVPFGGEMGVDCEVVRRSGNPSSNDSELT
jgi:hypothetical protein